MPPHTLTNFEIQKYYQNEPRFNGVNSRNNLPKHIKDGAYVINFDEHKDTVHIELLYFVKKMKLFTFYRFKVQHIPEEIKKFIGNKNTNANIYRVQGNNSLMCSYFCIGFIDFMLAGKTLIDYTNLFSPHGFNKNDSIILSYF